MSTQVKHRRGTNAEILAATPAVGELWFNTTDNSIHMGDGVTLGGVKHAKASDLLGVLNSPDLRDKKIEVVAGVIRQQPFANVSITSVGTTATVAHTAHGYSNGNNVHINGAVEPEYNGFFAISNVTTNTYDYTIVATTSPATGTTQSRNPARWGYLNDSGHVPLGVSGDFATASGGTITVTYNKTYSKVISFIVGPDERLANAHNLTVGASVGTSSAGIQCGATLSGESLIRWGGSSWLAATGTGQQLNFVPTFEDNAFGQDSVRITHDYCPGIGVSVSQWQNAGAVNFLPQIYSISNTDLVLTFVDLASPATPVNTGAENLKMAFKLKKTYSEGVSLDGTSNSYKLPLQDGNLWFFGIFEV